MRHHRPFYSANTFAMAFFESCWQPLPLQLSALVQHNNCLLGEFHLETALEKNFYQVSCAEKLSGRETNLKVVAF